MRCKNRNIFPYSCRNNLFSVFLSEKRGTMNKQSALLETGVDNQTEKEKNIYQFIWLLENMLYLCGVLFH